MIILLIFYLADENKQTFTEWLSSLTGVLSMLGLGAFFALIVMIISRKMNKQQTVNKTRKNNLSKVAKNLLSEVVKNDEDKMQMLHITDSDGLTEQLESETLNESS